MPGKAEEKHINLALQGGGAHGAVSWGVVDQLLADERIIVDAISGSSAGAVNAVAVAYGLHKNGRDGARETLEQVWQEVSAVGSLMSPIRSNPFALNAGDADNIVNAMSYHAFEAVTRTFSPYQYNPFNINPLRTILEKCIDFESLSACKRTKLYIGATNVRSGKVKVFDTKEVSVDVISASSCLPFLFRAVEIDGEHYWDGGYMGNPVLFPFFYEGQSADIMIVHVNPIEREEVPTLAPDIMNRVNEITFNSSLLRELRAISFVHKLLDEGWIKDKYRDRLRDIRIHSIRSDQALVDYDIASKFRTDWAFLKGMRDKGRTIAQQWLDEHFDEIGNNSSVNLREMFETD